VEGGMVLLQIGMSVVPPQDMEEEAMVVLQEEEEEEEEDLMIEVLIRDMVARLEGTMVLHRGEETEG